MSDDHRHIASSRVGGAAAFTIAAAAIELVAARSGHSLFLVADSLHLVAHLAIFGVLLIPARHGHEPREDAAAIVVLVVILLIAIGLGAGSVHRLLGGKIEVNPLAMLTSVAGLAANVGSAILFRDPARDRFSFRAALAHELSDGSLTIAGLVGAGAIALFGVDWVDPALSLAIVVWLFVWSARLLVARARRGREAWSVR